MASMKKILIAEDEVDLADIFILKLVAAGYCVAHALTGVEVLKMVKDDKPDLILLDVVMPQMDGYEALKQIKNDPSLKNTIVYIWSNLTQKAEMEKGATLGADGYIIKSDYTPGQLVEKINDILSKK